MRNLLLTITAIAIIGLSNLVNAQAPSWDWAKSAGGFYDESGYSVATDASGNVFMTGPFFSDSITFGTTTLINTGAFNSDIFIVKYDASGNVLWAKSAGGNSGDRSNSIATDASGNVFITGWFGSNTITFGTTILTNPGDGDIFIAKYDANGNVLWAKSSGGTAYDEGYNVSADKNGNLFITGRFRSPDITFGNITLTNTFAGRDDIFIVKYDAGGNVLWAKSAGGTDFDEARYVSTDSTGNVFMTGYFDSDSIIFGNTTLINAGHTNIFITKYDASGNILWAKSAGGTNWDYCISAATDANGNVFMTGSFYSNSITFGTTTLTNAGNTDIFIAKYDASGNVLWAKSAGSTDNDRGQSVATDANGNVFMIGGFYSPTITFGTTTLTNKGQSDIFIVKYDAGGNVVWAKSVGRKFNDYANAVAVDASGSIIIAGSFQSYHIQFGSTILANANATYADIFIAKLHKGLSTGIEEFNNNNTLSIYPNPAVNSITINGNNGQLEFVDVYGRIISTLKTSTAISTTVDVSAFPNMFFVRNSAGEVKKVVRQ